MDATVTSEQPVRALLERCSRENCHPLQPDLKEQGLTVFVFERCMGVCCANSGSPWRLDCYAVTGYQSRSGRGVGGGMEQDTGRLLPPLHAPHQPAPHRPVTGAELELMGLGGGMDALSLILK